MGRTLIVIGALLVVVGLLWPWLSKFGFGSLPGDIRIERKGWSFYFPLTSGILVSLILSAILWLLRK